MRSVGVCLLLVGLLAACAAPQVSLPSGVATILYANARADYAVAKVLAQQACRGVQVTKEQQSSWLWAVPTSRPSAIPKEVCDQLTQIDVRVQGYREAIERALMNPTQPVDWVQVLKYTEEVSALFFGMGILR